MQNLTDKLKRIKVDCLYGKKKHFNAGDRHEKIHYQIGVPLIIINVLTGSVLFYVLTDNVTNWIKFIPLVLALIAALLSGFQTYLNLPQKVEGHRRIGNRYLAVMKKCDRLQGYIADNLLSNEDIVNKLEEIAKEADDINQESEAFPTNKKDYALAQKGIKDGEENYTDSELEL
ncbi:SLATT domain-containing protein [Elizabethkingia meningoseptica]|uniref:SLATT domain-containing protein n=1 Tax=Elizabethkingia meningoseptica TaxID=238 RepID=UPI00136553F5|nr:SLATT domain-containing protein [Elizabethkingia meningoseptica]MDE5488083.1 SLATT domain-containing protein [Elizabethkingia meningoseptica]MVW91095.1 SLATT domain-containing protein [Elizabethkingia meningoseptica]